MKLEEDKLYVNKRLQVVHKIKKNGHYYVGKLLEKKDWILEFESNGECVTCPRRQSIIEKVTSSQLEHGIYSDFELSVIRYEDKIGTCTVHGVHSEIQFKIKTKKERLNNLLR